MAMTTIAGIDREAIARFCHRHHIKRLSIFGSVLAGRARPGSDVDILVEFEPDHMPGFAFVAIEEELSEIVGGKVDLQTPGSLSRHFRQRVLAEASPLYAE